MFRQVPKAILLTGCLLAAGHAFAGDRNDWVVGAIAGAVVGSVLASHQSEGNYSDRRHYDDRHYYDRHRLYREPPPRVVYYTPQRYQSYPVYVVPRHPYHDRHQPRRHHGDRHYHGHRHDGGRHDYRRW